MGLRAVWKRKSKISAVCCLSSKLIDSYFHYIPLVLRLLTAFLCVTDDFIPSYMKSPESYTICWNPLKSWSTPSVCATVLRMLFILSFLRKSQENFIL